jgi:hypothetical protein
MLEKTLILAYLGGFLNPSAKVLNPLPQKNIFKKFSPSPRLRARGNLVIKEGYFKSCKNNIHTQKIQNVWEHSRLVKDCDREHISTIDKKFECHGGQVKLDEERGVLLVIQIPENNDGGERQKSGSRVQKCGSHRRQKMHSNDCQDCHAKDCQEESNHRSTIY